MKLLTTAVLLATTLTVNAECDYDARAGVAALEVSNIYGSKCKIELTVYGDDRNGNCGKFIKLAGDYRNDYNWKGCSRDEKIKIMKDRGISSKSFVNMMNDGTGYLNFYSSFMKSL